MGLYVFYKNPQSKINLSFFLLTLSTTLLDFVGYNVGMARTYEIAYFWSIFYFTYHWGTLGQYLFVLAFTEQWSKVKSKINVVLVYFPAIIITILYVVSLAFYPNITATSNGWSLAQGKGLVPVLSDTLMSVWMFSLLVAMWVIVIKFYRTTFDPIKKIQVKYLLAGTILSLVIDSIQTVTWVFPEAVVPQTIVSGMTVFTAFVAVAIIKYDFLAINASTAADSIITTMTDAVFLLSSDFRIRLVNCAALRMVGQVREKMLGITIDSLVKLGPKKQLSRLLHKQLKQNDEVTDIEGVLLHDQLEEPIPVSLSASYITSSRGGVRGVVCIVRDISERKLQENRLKSSYDSLKRADKQIRSEIAKLQAILESVGEGLIVTDQFQKIAMINRGVSEILGWDEEKVLGESLYENFMLQTEKGEKYPTEERLTSSIQQGKALRLSLSDSVFIANKSGKLIPVTITTTPIKLEGKLIGTVTTFENITKDAAIDKAKSEFVSLAAHQLITPLTAILWNLESVRPETLPNEASKVEDPVSMAYNQATSMAALVNQFLNVSRIELGKLSISPEPIDMTAIVSSIVAEQQVIASQKKITIKMEFDKGLPKIQLDKVLIRVVVQNLVSNALKYSNNNGKVVISVTKTKQSVLLSVKDSGIGIPLAQQPQLFTKLFRAENVLTNGSEGNGLGLYLVKSIVSLMKGEISFSSIENEGTTFTVTIPLKGMKKQLGTRSLVEVHA
ncbi:hypothetical protein COX64_04610 [Candidatus Dojkabacteria bacterium CG_4_10_14_0_2_um_filter_Dojkabacteria_WS6_41_15]|uniref:histidine kinase n=1 Tax=Candidatus Dojkabacteria bacterium CG_4_10_14_0_2_um_filter_Dojkabacteria_WS6_41_15 TaxID=2014249 RepID=A0A2M7W0U0_9BACT|nr:MAG: hypothetical protein COX64_04610 [Candidatus Dojkabacteria bacterium CG_4_10_14_0_2_um_filter_Dojkabacteria_WS6_41_15]